MEIYEVMWNKFKITSTYIILLLICLLNFSIVSSAQSYNLERTTLANYLARMYKASPFEGVRVVKDYNKTYLMSVLSLDPSKYDNESTLNRIATVKAMSQASRFFNGSVITSELIIYTTEKPNNGSETTIIEKINESSIGYVQKLEQLSNFKSSDRQVFIFITEIRDDDSEEK